MPRALAGGAEIFLLKTLHTYLAKDLFKTMVLALAAFTLVMTVFAIIEPLRKRGLGAQQAILLFGYMLPVMVSLTMPIAALFAATMVYGRLSQDNELLACRASGVSTTALLRPVLLLGVIVTASTLYLSNSIAPSLWERMDIVKADLRGIMYQQLKSQMYVKMGTVIVHADAVAPERDTLYGVVIAQTENPKNVSIVAMQSAQMVFHTHRGETFADLDLQEAVGTQSSNEFIGREAQHPIESYPIKKGLKEDAAWYRWERLLSTFKNPVENGEIQRLLEDIRRDVAQDWLAKDIAAAIEANQPYTGLGGKKQTCSIQGGSAAIKKGGVEISADPAKGKRVSVTLASEGGTKTIEADVARVATERSRMRNVSVITMSLEGNVKVRIQGRKGDAASEEWVERDDARVGDLSLPKSLEDSLAKVDLRQLYENPAELTSSTLVAARVAALKDNEVTRLQSKILAEMHGRVAYGASCFLMVMMGAAMGMLYRGGQMISAFALSVIPASVVIIMMIMGQQLLCHPDLPRLYGLASIWGGIVMLLIGNAVLYLKLLRR